MDRRAAGGVVLLLALVCLLVAPRLTSPGVAGAAAIDPGPPPLPVGTCIADEVRTDGDPTGSAPTPRPVDCAEPHWGEVALLDEGAATDATPPPCRGSRIESYLTGAAATPVSTAAVRVDATALGPDPRQTAGGQRWSSCVVHTDAPLTVPLAGIRSTDAPPPGLGRC